MSAVIEKFHHATVNRENIMEKLAVAILVLLVLSACASSPKTNSPQVSQPAAATSSPQAGILPQAETESAKLAEQLQAMQKKSVYFDFDKYVVEPVYRDVVQQQADFIKDHGNEAVTLKGNADERGSDEYNLALGEKRASDVRKDLELLGVPEKRITILSLGEEKPRLTCHEESCWKENRRVDFVYNPNP